MQLNILRLEGEFRVPPLLVGARLILGRVSFKILKSHNHNKTEHVGMPLGSALNVYHHIPTVSGSYRSYGGKI